ncbi:MOSC domain-containing protein [Glutamicibacter endophyticus]|uniref:MOSC domain-containing protein n=1 Tax=Glutamicibacter endophyticus TaxID=1522174 RepID=UPI003AEF4B26
MKIERLFRFPIKGLPAEEISSAVATVNGGLTGDRTVAFSNGTQPVQDETWQRCTTFTILKNDTSLQRWQVSSQPPLITLTAPAAVGGGQLTFDATNADERAAATGFLAERLPAQGTHPRALISGSTGIFDSQKSGISFINPKSVAALSRAAGVELDPLRYRGNVLLADLPAFAEFDLIGKVLRIGETTVAITQSIERCRATSVNPVSTEVDVNGPRLLTAHCGHLHCGVYGTVLEGGRIQADDQITIAAQDDRAIALVKAKRTPRPLRIHQIRPIDQGCIELTLRDELGWIRAFDEPGTHLRLHLADPQWRNYTITSVNDDLITLAIRVQGEVSGQLAKLRAGHTVLASGPHGQLSAHKVLQGTTALISAGVGITPSLALLRGAAQATTLNALRILHVQRGTSGVLSTRLDELARKAKVPTDFNYFDSTVARPSGPEIERIVAGCDSVMVCGPADFTDMVLQACEAAGVAAQRIHREIFASPVQDMSAVIQRFEPATVTCHPEGTNFTWRPEAGVLLDALEEQGLTPDSSCRGGSCGECALRLLKGSVAYPIEPSAQVADDEILACMAVPAEDLELQL